jgi:hypothetical protein
MPRKPTTNKISKGRTPKPAVNKITNVNKTHQKGELKSMQARLSKIRNKLPVGANANNAINNRGFMMGGKGKGTLLSGAVLTAATPIAKDVGYKLGTKVGKALRPVGHTIDKVTGTKPKKKK